MFKHIHAPLLFYCSFLLSIILTTGACNRKSSTPTSSVQNVTQEIWEKDYIDTLDYDITKANTIFAFELFSTLDKTKNCIISPYSISSAMAMVYAGSKFETQRQFNKVFHFSFDKSQVYTGFKSLHEEIMKTTEGTQKQIYVTNSLWAQEKYSFLDPYFEICKKYFYSGFQYTDYINQHEKSRISINKWVEDNTSGKIKDILPESGVSGETRLILVNALYFNGLWQIPFDISKTEKLPFYLLDGTKKSARFMTYTKERLQYYQNDSFQILEIPYENNSFSMLVILPYEKYSNETQIRYSNYKHWMRMMRPHQVEVFLPRFSFSGNFNLSKTLISMGLSDAFSDQADFSDMSSESKLKLDGVFHQSFIDVHEKGTTAGASTAAVIKERSSSPLKIIFNADHPFIFIIKDNKNECILFIGCVTNPEIKK